MKLTELKPFWVVDHIKRRVGVMFTCPVCKGDKMVNIWCPGKIGVVFENPLEGDRNPNGITRIGNTFETLTLTRQIIVGDNNCTWRGHIAKGEVTGTGG